MSELKTADIELIHRLIPHRYPFLLIDKVIDIDGTASGVGIKNVTMNEPQFTGHFPSKPVFPGVLVVEAMAQTASTIVAVGMELEGKNALVYFMSIDNCRFRRKVVPGDQLRLELTTLRGGGKVWKFQGRATVDGEVACEAEIMAMLDVPK